MILTFEEEPKKLNCEKKERTNLTTTRTTGSTHHRHRRRALTM